MNSSYVPFRVFVYEAHVKGVGCTTPEKSSWTTLYINTEVILKKVLIKSYDIFVLMLPPYFVLWW